MSKFDTLCFFLYGLRLMLDSALRANWGDAIMLKRVSALIFAGCVLAAMMGCEAEANRAPAPFNPNAPDLRSSKSTPFNFGGGVLGDEAQGPAVGTTQTACSNDADCPEDQVCNPASNICEDDTDG